MGKRLLATILTASLSAVTLLGCGATSDSGTATQDTKAQESSSEAKTDSGSGSEAVAESSGYQTTYGSKQFDNVTLTVEVFDRSNAPEGSTVVDNKWVDYINENMNKVGINIEFVAVPRSEEVEKVQTMMASGTGADIMLCYTTSVVEGFFNDGGTYDLAPYIDGEGQAENLKKYIGEDCLNIARNSEGNLWAVAARRASIAQDETFIRKDWLDKLGMDVPTTVEEFEAFAKACKDNNPDGLDNVIATSFLDGKQLVAPMALAFCESVQDPKEWDIYGGNVSTLVYGDPGMGEYYRFMNKLYNEGLMDNEYFIHDDFGQTTKEYIVSGRQATFEMDANYQIDSSRGDLLINLKKNYPDADIVSIPPLKNVNDGVAYNAGYSMNGAFVFVPKTCENVEAAVTYLDWLATEEGGFVIYNGFEGEHYNMVDGVATAIDPEYNTSDRDWIRNDLFLVGNTGYFFDIEDYAKTTAASYPGYEDHVIENFANATAGTIRYAPTFSGAIWTEKRPQIDLVVDEYVVKLIADPVDKFYQNLSDFKAALKDAGIEEVIAERQEFYDAMYN